MKVRGAEMEVRTALRIGALARDASGRVVEGTTPVHATRQAPPPQPAKLALTAELPPAGAAIQAAILKNVPPTLLASALGSAQRNGEISQSTINAMASATGVTPDTMKANLSKLGAAMDVQGRNALAKLGIAGEEVYTLEAWLENTRPDVLRNASTKHIRGDLSGYQEAAQLYYENLDKINPHRILNSEFGSGITATLSGKTVVLNIPGKGQVSYAAAVRAGIVKVSGR